MRLISDLETNGLLETVTRVHCIVNKDADTKRVYCFHDDPAITPRDGSIADGLHQLETASVVVFHNGIKYDIRALGKLHPATKLPPDLDTLVMSRLIWPELKKRDIAAAKKGKYPMKLAGKYSLEAWGHRLGNHKGDFKGPWDTFTQAMLDYCVQDIEVTATLFARIEAKKYSAEAIQLEHDVARIVALQEINGFTFNEQKAGAYYAKLLTKRNQLEAKLAAFFPAWHETRGLFTPKKDNKKRGYTKDVPFTKIERIEFNPKSLDQIANRLITLYGWAPSEFTDGGKPKVDENTMKDLTYPPVPTIMECLLIAKRIGQVAEGKQAWLKVVRNGRIHGAVNTNGAVTGRMTHFFPNIAQVPKVGSAYGEECRSLFESCSGWVLVGADADGLELRMLGHYMAKWDGGAYASAVTVGKQADGTDVHSLNAKALGLDPQAIYTIAGRQVKGRDIAKTFIYAYLYGAGDEKIGKILGKSKAEGARIKAAFLRNLPALRKLKESIAEFVEKRTKRDRSGKITDPGYLTGLDGRRLHVRSPHAALNTLLQSAGALVMKKALVLLYDGLTASELFHTRDYGFCANVHDEWQIETSKEHADEIGTLAAQAIKDAGTHFKFRCDLAGSFKVGANWAETH